MKDKIDNLLANIFGKYSPQISLIVGILLVIAGIIVMVTAMTKGKRIVAWVCIGIGCIGIVSGILQA
jgi:uncharacterized membrane protein HdeD (DUF308 family)